MIYLWAYIPFKSNYNDKRWSIGVDEAGTKVFSLHLSKIQVPMYYYKLQVLITVTIQSPAYIITD